MTTIKYAILVPSGAGHQVGHLYSDQADAVGCAFEYRRARGIQAHVTAVVPPMPVARHCDMWAHFDPSAKVLHVAESEREARSHQGGEHIGHPIPASMPVNQGVPQFG